MIFVLFFNCLSLYFVKKNKLLKRVNPSVLVLIHYRYLRFKKGFNYRLNIEDVFSFPFSIKTTHNSMLT